MKTIFDLCKSRDDILKTEIGRTGHAPALAQMIRNSGSNEYRKLELFFTTPSPFMPWSMDQKNEDDGSLDPPAADVWRGAANKA